MIDQMLFWGIHKDISIRYEDLLDSHLTTGLFFGSLKIFSRFFADQTFNVNWLKIHDARKFHALIHGFITAQKEEIDLDNIPAEELVEMIERIGSK